MKLQIIYDNSITRRDYLPGWGFSCLVDQDILFDTGEFPEILFHNMAILGIIQADIRQIVISHDHYDHQGGLPLLLENIRDIDVFLGKRFSPELEKCIQKTGNILIKKEGWLMLKQNIYLTPSFLFQYKGTPMSERALVITARDGLVLITGCSHPGIAQIAETVQNHFPDQKFSLIAGGFHLKDSSENEIETIVKKLQNMAVKQVAPTHCTGNTALDIFKYYFKENCLTLGAGCCLDIPV